MPESGASLKKAVETLQATIALIEWADDLVSDELTLAGQYRDDAAYRSRWDHAYAKSVQEKGFNAEWPSFETQPLRQADIFEHLEKCGKQLWEHSLDDEPHEILFVAVHEAFSSYVNALCSMTSLNEVMRWDPKYGDGWPPQYRVLTPIVQPSSPYAVGRCVDDKKRQAEKVYICKYSADRLVRYCRRALELLHSAERVLLEESTFTVHYLGRHCDLGNTRQFALLRQLVLSRGKYVDFTALAERMGGDDGDDIRPVKCRLVKALGDAGMSDLAEGISTQDGHYGLFVAPGANQMST
jgi:hypothetical protein